MTSGCCDGATGAPPHSRQNGYIHVSSVFKVADRGLAAAPSSVSVGGPWQIRCVRTITVAAARRAAVTAQGFGTVRDRGGASPTRRSVLGVVRNTKLLQLDSV